MQNVQRFIQICPECQFYGDPQDIDDLGHCAACEERKIKEIATYENWHDSN